MEPLHLPTTHVSADGDALRKALESAESGAVLRLAAGVYVGPFVTSASVKLVADAPGDVILRGEGRGGLLRLEGRRGELALFGLILENGGDTSAGGGVAAPNGGRIVLNDCEFRDCRATGFGGGAVALRRGRLIAQSCRFVRCHGRQGGAVLVTNDCDAQLIDCRFDGCTAEHGGAAVAVRDRPDVLLQRCDLRGLEPPAIIDEQLGWAIDVRLNGRGGGCELRSCRIPGDLHAVRGV